MNEFLESLKGNHQYNDLIKSVNKNKPVIPRYDYDSNNTEDWKAKSNMLKGFELAMALMGDNQILK